MKNKFLVLLVAIISTLAYFYAGDYIPIYCFSFDNVLIDYDKHPDIWNWSPSILNLVASLIILLLAYIYSILIKKFFISKKEKSIQPTITNKKSLFVISILGGIIMVFSQLLFSLIFLNISLDTEPLKFELWLTPMLISTCVTYPIAEELFFRKGILNLLYSKLNINLSIFLSSILFAFFHYPNQRQMILTFIVGIILGKLYVKSNKILYPILFHISLNTTVTILHYISF